MKARRVRKVPLRICAGCQAKRPKKELVRIVRTPEDTVEIDFTGKRSGRGTYLCYDPGCLKKAVKGKRIEKNLHRAVLPEVVEELERCLQEEMLRQQE